MQITTFSNFRAHLKQYLIDANTNYEPIFITTTDGKRDGVLISKDVYDNMIEKLYIRASEVNSKQLDKSIQNMESGNYHKAEIKSWEDLRHL